MRKPLSLNPDDLTVDSFVPGGPGSPGITEQQAVQSEIVLTVYVYEETEPITCGSTCGCVWA